MSELIDREALLQKLHDELFYFNDWESEDDYMGIMTGLGRAIDIVKAIKEEPKVDAEPVKHGEWIERKVFEAKDSTVVELQSARCSVCGRYHTTPYIYRFYEDNYCPYCGAKMERRKD